jgi:hypothetical protein
MSDFRFAHLGSFVGLLRSPRATVAAGIIVQGLV